MTKEQKKILIDNMAKEFSDNENIIIADYKGLSHKALEDFRKTCAKDGTKVRIIKNTLATLALKKASKASLELSGTNIFIWGNDQIATCKNSDKFASQHKKKFIIKGGIIENELADLAKINQFAKLKSKDELLGMLLSVWNGPIRNWTVGLSNLAKSKE
jgi:large subunit ribosomal protein L10